MLPLQEGLKPGILPTLYQPSQLSPSRTSPRLQLTPFSLYETQFKQLTAHTSTTHVTCPPRCFDFKKSSNFSLLHRWQSALANSVHWPNHRSQPRQPYLSSPSTSLCPWHSPQFAFSMEVMFEFLRTYDFTPVPASPYAVDSHTCYLTRKTSSHQYVLNPLNVIRLLHCYNSCTVDTLDNFDVSFKKCGSKHLLGTAIHQKHPVTPSILLEIRHHLNTNLPLHSAICALFCTAFFSFLHKLNLTVASATSSATSFDPRCHRQDVTQSTSLHTLDENSPPQGRPPYHSASQHSRLYSLPYVCPSTILYARPHFLISTVVLSSHYFWPSSCYLCYL